MYEDDVHCIRRWRTLYIYEDDVHCIRRWRTLYMYEDDVHCTYTKMTCIVHLRRWRTYIVIFVYTKMTSSSLYIEDDVNCTLSYIVEHSAQALHNESCHTHTKSCHTHNESCHTHTESYHTHNQSYHTHTESYHTHTITHTMIHVTHTMSHITHINTFRVLIYIGVRHEWDETRMRWDTNEMRHEWDETRVLIYT